MFTHMCWTHMHTHLPGPESGWTCRAWLPNHAVNETRRVATTCCRQAGGCTGSEAFVREGGVWGRLPLTHSGLLPITRVQSWWPGAAGWER